MDWHSEHRAVEEDFLSYLGSNGNLVLKGGTSLMLCYGLNRFSEDLDFDALRQNASTRSPVETFCKSRGYECFLKKDTPTVQRLTIHYGGDKPLKVETSYRRLSIPESEVSIVNGILTYKIDVLARMKLNAYLSRDRIRDLFDVTFIVNNYFDSLQPSTKSDFQMAFAEKGLEQFDAVVNEQQDELIDTDQLIGEFLRAFDRAGVAQEPPISQKPQTRSISAALTSSRSQSAIANDSKPHVGNRDLITPHG